MALSKSLVQQFAKLAVPKEKKNESTVNGTVKIIDNTSYVQLDGSDILTPVSTTVEIKDSERVKVLIKDHTATVTDNISSPMARTATVTELANIVDQNGNTISQLDNVITQQGNSIIQMNNSIQQQNDTINSFGNVIDAQNNKIQAHDTYIQSINSDITTINSSLSSQGSQISSLNDTVTSQGNSITSINNDITSLNNTVTAQGNTISAHGTSIQTFDSSIRILNTGFTIQDGVLTGLSSAVINNLKTTSLDADYAQIDFANIGTAAVEKIFADSGIIDDLVVQEGHITGELVGVTIKGDLIEGNTIVADKLVIKGNNGLYYKLNTNGETTTSEQTQYNSLNGSVITAKSITADRVNVSDLVAFGATIGGFHITANSIYSGAKSSINSSVSGMFLGSDGQLLIGDGENYIKYYLDSTDNTWKLDIKSERFIDLMRSASGEHQVLLENCAEGPLQTLHLTGEMIPTFPHNRQYPSSSLYPSTYPHITVTYTVNNEQHQERIRLPFDYLGKVGDVHDEFELNNVGQTYLTRRIGLNEYGEQYVLQNEQVIECGVLVIPLHFGDCILSCPPYNVVSMDVSYAIRNEFTDIFATQLDLSSKIQKSASEIELSVDGKLTDATSTQNLISKINLKPGQILLEGTVTANGNFKILKDGSIEANNGKFSGDIYLGEGKKVIGGQGLFSCLSYTSMGRYSNWDVIGFGTSGYNLADTDVRYQDVIVNAYIPENFVITSAYVMLQVTSVNTAYEDASGGYSTIGKPKKIGLMVGETNASVQFFYYPYQAVDEMVEYTGTEVPNAFGIGRYTPKISNPGQVVVTKSIDIKDYLVVGKMNTVFVRSLLSPKPEVHTFTPSGTSYTATAYNYKDVVENTGVGRLNLFVFGYMSMEGV